MIKSVVSIFLQVAVAAVTFILWSVDWKGASAHRQNRSIKNRNRAK